LTLDSKVKVSIRSNYKPYSYFLLTLWLYCPVSNFANILHRPTRKTSTTPESPAVQTIPFLFMYLFIQNLYPRLLPYQCTDLISFYTFELWNTKVGLLHFYNVRTEPSVISLSSFRNWILCRLSAVKLGPLSKFICCGM